MDLFLTYDNEGLYQRFCCSHPGNVELLNVEQWKRVIEILWNAGVPHILFAGGEPTSREHFVDLVRFAEDIGIVTGILTNGEKLADMKYTNELVEAGLDHLQITVQSHKPGIHDALVSGGSWKKTVTGLENAIATPLYCVVYTTFTKKNKDDIPAFVDFLKQKGVYAFAANALGKETIVRETNLSLSEDEIMKLIKTLSNELKKREISFVWYGDEHSEEESITSGVWEFSMCIEPDGIVAACEKSTENFGNILKSNWEGIWKQATRYNKK
jgi:MoaA/NifB/PqqE/SkfB family radical SAM enzyme